MATANALLDPTDQTQGPDDPYMDPYPGDDMPVAAWDDLSVIQVTKAYWEESDSAHKPRERLNKINNDAFNCRQDTSGKLKGQSMEFLPKTPMAVEQLKAFIKQGLIAYGNWFSVELTPDPAIVGGPLSESAVEKLMRHRLESPEEIPPGCLDFPTVVSDGVGAAALTASFILKVHGQFVPTRRLSVDVVHMEQAFTDPISQQTFQATVPQEQLSMVEGRVWRLLIELVREEDFRPDPTGRGLYEIHRTCVDLHEIIDLSEGDTPEYDPDAVQELTNSYAGYTDEDENLDDQTGQGEATHPSFRKTVELKSCWGTILDSEGKVVHRNVRWTVANDKYLIRKPEPNPFWHQESPFVVGSLLRVPFSVFHRALFDNAVRLNLAMNELFNLMIDGSIGAVWGVRQVKPGMIANFSDFTDGIPQGATLFVKDEMPDGQPVMIQVPAGVVPPEAMAMYQLLDREFASATMLSDTARGMTPKRQVSATAVASADQSTSIFFDSIIANVEQSVIKKALRLAWMVMLQNCDDWLAEDVVGCIGPQAAQALAAMSPAMRYKTYAQGARFNVTGLSSLLARTREFQKIMAVVGALSQSPVLLQAFMAKSSPEKMVDHLLKSLNIDPDDLQMTEEEKATLDQRIQQLPMYGNAGMGAQGDQQPQMAPNQQVDNQVQQVQSSINSLNQVPQGL